MLRNKPKDNHEYNKRVKAFKESLTSQSTFTRLQINEMADLYEYRCNISYHGTSCGTCIRRMLKRINQDYIHPLS